MSPAFIKIVHDANVVIVFSYLPVGTSLLAVSFIQKKRLTPERNVIETIKKLKEGKILPGYRGNGKEGRWER